MDSLTPDPHSHEQELLPLIEPTPEAKVALAAMHDELISPKLLDKLAKLAIQRRNPTTDYPLSGRGDELLLGRL